MQAPTRAELATRYRPLAGFFDHSKTEQTMLAKFKAELTGCRIYIDHSNPKGAMIWRLRGECKTSK